MDRYAQFFTLLGLIPASMKVIAFERRRSEYHHSPKLVRTFKQTEVILSLFNKLDITAVTWHHFCIFYFHFGEITTQPFFVSQTVIKYWINIRHSLVFTFPSRRGNGRTGSGSLYYGRTSINIILWFKTTPPSPQKENK